MNPLFWMLVGTVLAEESPLSHCQSTHPMVGTTAWRTSRQALVSNADTFGTAQFSERVLFPSLVANMEPGQTGFAVATEFNWVYNMLDVPSVEEGCVPEMRYSLRGLDLGALSFGGAVSFGRFGLFYSAGATSSAPSTPEGRVLLLPATTVFGAIAPLYRLEAGSGLWSISSDWTAGAVFDAEYATLRAGWVGSSGFYTNVSQESARVFAAALITNQFQDMPYLRAGLDRLVIPKVGMLSGFYRKLPLDGTPAYDPVTGEALAQPEDHPSASLATSHVQWQDLFEVADVEAAYATKPERLLYELRFSLHTRGANPKPPFGSPFTDDDDDDEAPPGGFLVSGGFLTLPDMYYYGIEGGRRATFSMQANVGHSEVGAVYVALRYNDPELLAIFPYATNAWGLYLQGGRAGSVER